ncbi:MAG: carbohydrate ABC transporter permease [Pleurocapsa minor GSE-CHR-MK-17-07R]|jgi:multiple sugar transport system permease protein|nr:carbohydrate ABC transporter permease [Pleurocapsa minor GSE-CHR-MK 17-07R]
MTDVQHFTGKQRERRSFTLNTRQSTLLMKTLAAIILLFGLVVMMLPFLWMVSTAFKQPTSIFVLPPEWIPANPTLENFTRAWEIAQLPRGFLNSAFIAIVSTVGEVFFATLAGFAFSRMRFPGRDKLFGLLLATLTIPGVVMLVPAFILFSRVGWVNTWNPLIIPVMFGTPFAIFLSRQFFATLPDDLSDAAKVDGANWFQTYFFIFMPLARPIIATLFVLGFIARWNDFLNPLIYLRSVELFPVPLLLARLDSMYEQNWTLLMAGATLALLPILALFFALQRYFVESVALTGSKG